MRLLMLHGYGESGPHFETTTLPLQKSILTAFPSTAFFFPTAPNFAARTFLPTSSTSSDNHCWLPDTLHRGRTNPLTSSELDGVHSAWRFLSQTLDTHGPFDGIIAFSQGASVGVVLASALEPGRVLSSVITDVFTTNHPPMKFVVSIAGFKSPMVIPGMETIYDPKISTPVLHVLGRVDDHLGEGEMWELVQVCGGGDMEEPERVIWWDGGHYVPGKRAVMAKIMQFIQEVMDGQEEEA